jgi:hypothetical protein
VFHRWGHQRSFDKAVLRSELEDARLNVVALRTHAFPDYSKNLPFNRLRQWLRWILGRLGSRLVYSSLFFVVIK